MTDKAVIERVARALFDDFWIRNVGGDGVEKAWLQTKHVYIGNAKAVIQTLRDTGLLLEWRDDMDAAPRDGTWFLAWWGGGVRLVRWLDNTKTSHPWAGWTVPSLMPKPPAAEPDAWMPLPAPPQEDEP